MLVVRGRGGEVSLIRLEPSNLTLEAVKLSEDDDNAIIVRISEIANARGIGQLTLPFKPRKAVETNIIEDEEGEELEIEGNKVKIKYKNKQTKTIKIWKS
ncbi:MAG: glycosyl hydrolase-related protein, partial [Caldivirga sp.]